MVIQTAERNCNQHTIHIKSTKKMQYIFQKNPSMTQLNFQSRPPSRDNTYVVTPQFKQHVNNTSAPKEKAWLF